MIPLRDTVPRVTLPIAVVGLICLNVLVALFTGALNPTDLGHVFYLHGMVPARFLDPQWAALAGYPESWGTQFVSYMFLHSGWLHLILNMWMLWIFGDNIEDVTGHGGFVVFYLLCGLAAAGLHMAFEPAAHIPVVGASGAVAGIMGAYIVLYPHGRVLTLVPIFFIPLFLRIPSSLFLGIWFASQIWSGFISTQNPTFSEVAWWAHVGGFVAGAVLIQWFRRKGQCRYCYNPKSRDYEAETFEDIE